MQTDNIRAIVLAAGSSTRFKTGANKMLSRLCGQEMILFPLSLLHKLAIRSTLVIGHEQEALKQCIKTHQDTVQLGDITFCVQQEQNGTGHAVQSSACTWDTEHILVMNGDMPLIDSHSIENLMQEHMSKQADVTFAMSHHTDPTSSYGRVVTKDGVTTIIEAKDFTGDVHENCCINAGIYLFKKSFLEQHIKTLTPDNAAHELYLTDLIGMASKQETLASISIPFDQARGVNNQHELWAAEQVMRSGIIKNMMEHGVRFSSAHNVHIDLNVTISSGSYIGCGVHLLNGTQIGANCIIDEYSTLEATIIGNSTHIMPFTLIKQAIIGDTCTIGPFAHIKDQTIINNDVVIGNFVEIKNSTIASGTKAKHLTYIGDATIGKEVNVGAGTIICNFDGRTKHRTTIEDNAFIGSNSTLIAPLHVGTGSFTAAGSTINKDVPTGALAIGRSRQENKHDYARKLIPSADEEPIEHNSTHSEKSARFMGAVRTNHDIPHEER